MRITRILIVLAAVSLTGCSTTNRTDRASAQLGPETVLVTYRVKPGNEAEFQSVLSRAWHIYRAEHLVYVEPHIIVREAEDGGKICYIEIFTWVSRAALEHAPDSVKTIWKEEHSLCETRNGHSGIEGGEVGIVTGGRHIARWP